MNECLLRRRPGPVRAVGPQSFTILISVIFALLAVPLSRAAAPPQINDFFPTDGPVGTQVSVAGNNLVGITSVLFNGVPAQFTAVSAQECLVIVPTGAASGPITIVTTAGQTSSSSSFFVTATPPPRIAGFTPTSGPPGTEVTINGENLMGATAVLFNGVAASFQAGFSGTNLVAVVPVGASSGLITVVTLGGNNTSASGFTVASPPAKLVSFSPDRGPAGSNVLITGENLLGVTEVRFAGVVATFTFLGNSISAQVPEGANSGPITLVSPGGITTSSNGFIVLQAGAPTLTSISPPQGMSGTSVTLTGSNLETVTAVMFNGAPAEFFAFGSSIFATVPANASTGPVTVVNPQGATSSNIDFILIDPLGPIISGFSPNAGPEGMLVTISGTNLVNVTKVTFGGVVATSVTPISQNQLQAAVPMGALTGPIGVTTLKGAILSSEPFYTQAKITGFQPTYGPVGTTVLVKGANFVDATAVLVGGVSASFSVIAPGEIRLVVPEGATSGAISIATAAGFAISDANFLLPPRILSVAPASAAIGANIQITGENLLALTDVEFGGVPASFQLVSETAVNAVVPAGAKSGPITIATPAGFATSPEAFGVGVFSDVAVLVSASPDSVVKGDFLRYSITVTNQGPASANNVVLTEKLPSGVQMIFAPVGADCVQSGDVITCALGELVNGAAANVQISVLILDGPYLTNRVSVTSGASDPDLGNNTLALLTVLHGAPPPPPAEDVVLGATLVAGALELSWPTDTGSVVVETAPSLSPPVVWMPEPTPPVSANGVTKVRLNPTSGRVFFRLRAP